MTHHIHASATFVHPAKVPHSQSTPLSLYGTKIITSSLFPEKILRLVVDANAMVVVVAHFDQRIDIVLGRRASPLDESLSGSLVILT